MIPSSTVALAYCRADVRGPNIDNPSAAEEVDEEVDEGSRLELEPLHLQRLPQFEEQSQIACLVPAQ